MEDSELARIRAARLAELQASRGGASSQSEGEADPEVKRAQEATQRHAMLSQILDASARDRLRRIAIVKPDRARAVEDLIMRMANSGQIRQRIQEKELVGLLEEISGQEADRRQGNKIINARRRDLDDSDDDWN